MEVSMDPLNHQQPVTQGIDQTTKPAGLNPQLASCAAKANSQGLDFLAGALDIFGSAGIEGFSLEENTYTKESAQSSTLVQDASTVDRHADVMDTAALKMIDAAIAAAAKDGTNLHALVMDKGVLKTKSALDMSVDELKDARDGGKFALMLGNNKVALSPALAAIHKASHGGHIAIGGVMHKVVVLSPAHTAKLAQAIDSYVMNTLNPEAEQPQQLEEPKKESHDDSHVKKRSMTPITKEHSKKRKTERPEHHAEGGKTEAAKELAMIEKAKDAQAKAARDFAFVIAAFVMKLVLVISRDVRNYSEQSNYHQLLDRMHERAFNHMPASQLTAR
jgi:hypothetical protein